MNDFFGWRNGKGFSGNGLGQVPYYSYSEDKIEPYDNGQNSNYHDLY